MTPRGQNKYLEYIKQSNDKYGLSDTFHVSELLQNMKKGFNYRINNITQCIVYLKLKEQYKMALICHQTLRIHINFK